MTDPLRLHAPSAPCPLPRRWLLQGAVLLAAGTLAGCPPVQHIPVTMPASTQPGAAPVIGTEPTAGGIFLPLATHNPLTGDALRRAMLDRKAILQAVKASPALTSPASRPAATQSATQSANSGRDESEPPPLAIKYYLQGRSRFLDGANSEAMDDLDKALALDPNAFTVLRLMGRVCFASSQLARGSLFLQRAYAIDPDDVEVNYLLGRYWLERKENDRAVSHLMQADESPERRVSSAQTPLVSFYLARALQSAGYHKAAAGEFERFLETITLPVAGYRYDRELNYLIEESWAAHLAAAENDVAVGAFSQALPHYMIAHQHEPGSAFIAARFASALVYSGHAAAGRQVAMSLVSESAGSEDSIRLLAWTYQSTGHEKDLLADLHARARNSNDAAATLTLAAAQDYLGQKAEAFETLRAYLQTHLDDLDVLDRLLKRIDSAAAFGRALQSASAVLAHAPAKQEEILKRFLPAAESPAAAAFAGDMKITPRPAASPYESYLLGETFRAQDDLPRAEAAFRQAAMLPAFFPAKEALISTLTAEEKFSEASQIIQDAISHDEGGAKAYQLLIESEAGQDRIASALKIALQAKAKFPDSPELRLQLAAIYRLRGQDDLADAELTALIDASPKFEPAYRALVNSLLSRARADEPGAAKLQAQAIALLSKLLREIPGSVFGRVTTAIINAPDSLDESEVILERLLVEQPDDLEVLIPLAQIRQAMGRPEEAAATLEIPLKKHPSPELGQMLAELFRRRQDKPAEALALTQRLMNEHPGVESYTIVNSDELLAQKKNLQAVALLAAAAEKSPRSQPLALALARAQAASNKPADAAASFRSFIEGSGETPQRLYLLAHFQNLAGLEADSEATLEKVLALNPDHTGANNDLGYFWADAGKNLDKARAMIEKALDNQPNNSAFLDSLGWVYYKQGKFKEAVTCLEKAVALPDGTEPEVMQHLGDSLYRAGRTGEAAERWLQALGLLTDRAQQSNEDEDAGAPRPLTHDEEKIKTYLEAALAAVKSRSTPALSPLGNPH